MATKRHRPEEIVSKLRDLPPRLVPAVSLDCLSSGE